MKKKVKFLALGLAAVISLSAFAGCTPKETAPVDPAKTEGTTEEAKPDEAKPEAAATGEVTEIRVTFRDDGLANQGPLYKWIEGISATYPDKSVKIVPAPIQASEGDYFAKIALALQSADTAPDIVTEDTFMINSDASAGYLEPLTDKLATWDEWTNGSFIESLKQGVTAQDGQVYGVPYNTDSRGLFYNKKVIEKAGLPADWAPKTWAELLDGLRKIKSTNAAEVAMWMNSGKATGEGTTMQTYEMLLYGAGGTLTDESGKWIVKSAAMDEALKFIETIYKEQLGPPLSKVLNGQAGTTSAREYLPQAKLGVSLDGSWITGNYIEGGASPWPEHLTDLGFVAFPTIKGEAPGSVTMAGGWALSIPKNSKNKDAAFEVVKYATNFENMKKLALSEKGNVTTRTDIAKDSEYAADPFVSKATDFLAGANFRPALEAYPGVSTLIQEMVESVVTGTSPADASAKFKTDVTALVGAENIVEK